MLRADVSAVLIVLLVACGGASGDGGSIGAVLGRDNDSHKLFVRDAPEGLAADDAGLLPGDEIVMIDGVYAGDLGPDGIRKHLRGPVGSMVLLTVVRGREVLHVNVKRAEMKPGKAVQPAETKIAE